MLLNKYNKKMRKWQVLIFISVVLFLALFNARGINYDDVIYFKAAEHIQSSGVRSLLTAELEFLGQVYNYRHGTHSMLLPLLLSVMLKFGMSLRMIHLVLTLIYASAVFPVCFILKYFKVKNILPALMLIMFSPAAMANANTFMTDIPGYTFAIISIAAFLASERRRFVFLIIALAAGITAALFSYMYAYVFFLFILYSAMKNRRMLVASSLITAAAAVTMTVFMVVGWIPSAFQALSWPGSETLFNFHRTGYKFMALAVLMGFSGIVLAADREIYKDPMNIGIGFLGIIFSAFLSGYTPISRILLVFFTVTGLVVIYRLFYYGHEEMFLYSWYAVYAIAGVLFFPMVVSRYMLLALLPLLVIFAMRLGRKTIITGVVLNILLSSLILYADMKQTDAYSAITAKADYFTGEWAFREHMEESGAQMLMKTDSVLPDSAVICIPDLEVPSELNTALLTHLEPVCTDSVMPGFVQILTEKGKAGFQTNGTGLLPLTLISDFSIRVSRLLFTSEENTMMAQYADRIVLWLETPVIPLNIPDTLNFESAGPFTLRIRFFPSHAVHNSDGIGITVSTLGGEYIFKAYPDSLNTFIIDSDSGAVNITADNLENDNYDWAGIYVKEND